MDRSSKIGQKNSQLQKTVFGMLFCSIELQPTTHLPLGACLGMCCINYLHCDNSAKMRLLMWILSLSSSFITMLDVGPLLWSMCISVPKILNPTKPIPIWLSCPIFREYEFNPLNLRILPKVNLEDMRTITRRGGRTITYSPMLLQASPICFQMCELCDGRYFFKNIHQGLLFYLFIRSSLEHQSLSRRRMCKLIIPPSSFFTIIMHIVKTNMQSNTLFSHVAPRSLKKEILYLSHVLNRSN